MIAGPFMLAWLLAAAQADPRPPVLSRDVPLARLTIPDEIGPAVAPYVRCRLLSKGVRMGPPGAQEIPTARQIGADCGGARREAARLAERMLKQRGRGSASQRRAFIEKVLTSVDGFVGKSIPVPSGPESRPHAEH